MDQIVFPQANDFTKIIRIMNLDEKKLFNYKYIGVMLNVTQRQVSYYLSACKFLRLIDGDKFTELGKSIKNMGIDMKIKTYIKVILEVDLMFDIFYDIVFKKQTINLKEIASRIYIKNLVVSESVALRRASTVKNWIKWILSQIEEPL